MPNDVLSSPKGIYGLARAILFRFDPEKVHNFTLAFMRYAALFGIPPLAAKLNKTENPVRAMGLTFPNPVGLAAGLDKDGVAVEMLGALGFGFIETGTVTPKAQPGNPKPRLFRIPEREAIINRMGFNNRGIGELIKNVSGRKTQSVLGINIGKQKSTPVSEALGDYLFGMDKAYPHADYIAVNISSPNTPDLRSLQREGALDGLLRGLKKRHRELAEEHEKYKPLVLKIAPDLETGQIEHISELLLKYEIDGLIATNTTVQRGGVEDLDISSESGGLSGKPLYDLSTEILQQFSRYLKDEVTLIAAGGILSGDDAVKKIASGAKLVQIYSGFIFRGPALIKEINDSLISREIKDNRI
jgi:dihydroorotate dehydrogenase